MRPRTADLGRHAVAPAVAGDAPLPVYPRTVGAAGGHGGRLGAQRHRRAAIPGPAPRQRAPAPARMRYPLAVDLDGPELRSLASMYARRFPRRADRLRIAHGAGLETGWTDFSEAEAAWESLLTRAQQVDALSKVAEAASSERPADENLGELARTLRAAGRRSPWAAVVLLGVGIAVGLAIGIPVGRGSVPGPVATVLPVVAPSPPAPPVEAPDDDAVADAPPADEAAVPEPLPEANFATPSDETQPALLPEGCRGALGTVVGYWYAGEESPGRAGTPLTLDKAIRVRKDFPRAENNWSKDAEVRCVVPPGAHLRLSGDPVSVQGGGWWVPLGADDLQP